MNSKILIGLIIGIVLVSGCIKPGEEPSTPKLSYSISGCDVQRPTKSVETKAYGNIAITSFDDFISIKHDLSYVCCADIKVEWDIKGDVINVREVNEGDVCRCICEYKVNAKIGPLDSGRYTVKVYGVGYRDIEPDLLAEEEVGLN
jgi:hypothetical protein